MITISDLKALGIKIASVRGEEVLAHCPYHDDSHPSFSANLKKEVFICFGCGKTGKLSALGLKSSRRVTWDDFLHLLPEKEEDYIIPLPDSFMMLDRSNPYCKAHWDYLDRRGITSDVAYKFGLGWCYEGYYKDRIIVPLPVGFIARSIYDGRMGWIMYGSKYRKYLFPLGLQMSRLIYNLDISKRVITIVEGAFDVLRLASIGIHACSVLTCRMSQTQLELICDKANLSRIYVCFDADDPGREGAYDVGRELSRYFGKSHVFEVKLPEGKDPADCNRYELIRAFREAEPFYLGYEYLRIQEALLKPKDLSDSVTKSKLLSLKAALSQHL